MPFVSRQTMTSLQLQDEKVRERDIGFTASIMIKSIAVA